MAIMISIGPTQLEHSWAFLYLADRIDSSVEFQCSFGESEDEENNGYIRRRKKQWIHQGKKGKKKKTTNSGGTKKVNHGHKRYTLIPCS